jgi:hypothetical protein
MKIAPGGEVLVYRAPDGRAQVEVRLDKETVWLTQDQLSQLFGRERSVITKHIRNVFKERELAAKSVCAKFAHTAEDGKGNPASRETRWWRWPSLSLRALPSRKTP